MIKTQLALLVVFFQLNMNGGGFIDEDTITLFVMSIILVHLLVIGAYISKILWLRVVAGVLYLPVFLIPLVLTSFNAGFALVFVPPLLFFYFMIVKERNEFKKKTYCNRCAPCKHLFVFCTIQLVLPHKKYFEKQQGVFAFFKNLFRISGICRKSFGQCLPRH